MGKTCHFHVTAPNKAPCSQSRQSERFLLVAEGYANHKDKIMHLNCPLSPSWRSRGRCQPIASLTSLGCLSIWEPPSTNCTSSTSPNFFLQVFLQWSCPHYSWKEVHMVGRDPCSLLRAGQKVSGPWGKD